MTPCVLPETFGFPLLLTHHQPSTHLHLSHSVKSWDHFVFSYNCDSVNFPWFVVHSPKWMILVTSVYPLHPFGTTYADSKVYEVSPQISHMEDGTGEYLKRPIRTERVRRWWNVMSIDRITGDKNRSRDDKSIHSNMKPKKQKQTLY